ncbi:hypothetical protein [uncultured Aquimarina sp.]|uniref:hypothetical protein n=1 Tax=uncultured Aquimarina sp. TaxID=575652 RepID=UPI00262F13B6|nr:hypothetical protein [uncultured Aquimarina sp.]
MKFNQFSKKEQEIRNYLLADAFAGFDGIGLHTSVVNTTPVKMPNANGTTALETVLNLTSMHIREVLVTDSYTSHIV